MARFFDWIGEGLPSALWLILWALLFPIRMFFLLLIPPGAKSRHHALHTIYEFFAFEGK
jgi:hypothetical protein